MFLKLYLLQLVWIALAVEVSHSSHKARVRKARFETVRDAELQVAAVLGDGSRELLALVYNLDQTKVEKKIEDARLYFAGAIGMTLASAKKRYHDLGYGEVREKPPLSGKARLCTPIPQGGSAAAAVLTQK